MARALGGRRASAFDFQTLKRSRSLRKVAIHQNFTYGFAQYTGQRKPACRLVNVSHSIGGSPFGPSNLRHRSCTGIAGSFQLPVTELLLHSPTYPGVIHSVHPASDARNP